MYEAYHIGGHARGLPRCLSQCVYVYLRLHTHVHLVNNPGVIPNVLKDACLL